jgi:hypothetical protein
MSVNIKTISNYVTKEDILVSELVNISLSEERFLKIEAGSEGEDEMGGIEITTIGNKAIKTYKPMRFGGRSGLRGYASSERYPEFCRERKRKLMEELRKPPTFRGLSISHTSDGNYRIRVIFERLGKKRKLEVNTPTLSSRSIRQLLQNNLSQACLSIPYSDIVVESIKTYFEEKVYPRLEK